MKILPKHESLRIHAYWLFALGAILILFFPFTVAFIFQVHVIWLILAVLLIFTPWGNQHAGQDKTTIHKLPFSKALCFTFLLQITLFLAFYSICHLVSFSLPVGVTPTLLFENMAPILLLDWGIFPWGAYALLAAAVSYTVYIKKQPGDMSTLLRPLLKNIPGDSLSLTLDVCTKIAITLTLGWTFAFLSMECLSLMGRFFHLPMAYGLRMDVMLAMLLMFSYSRSDSFVHQIAWLSSHLSAPWVITIFLILSTSLVLFIGSLIGIFSPIFTPILAHASEFAPWDWSAIWIVFSGMWWLGWAPLAAGLLAYVWRGYRIRTLLFWTLLFPIILAGLQIQYPHWQLSNLLNSTDLINLIPAVLSIVLIISIFLRARFMTFVSKGTLPLPTHHYRRTPQVFLKMLLQFIFIMFMLYWMGGIYIVGMMGFIGLLPAALIVLTAGIGAGWKK